MKKDKTLIALILDSYDPKTDSIMYINTKTGEYLSGRYHPIHDRSVGHHISPDSPEEHLISNLVIPPSRRKVCDVIYTDKFSNPNRTRQGGAA